MLLPEKTLSAERTISSDKPSLSDKATKNKMAYSTEQLHLWRAETIRSRCREVLEKARRGELIGYEYYAEKLPTVADFVVQVIRESHPSLDVPPHSRWRHFSAGGVDRWSEMSQAIASATETSTTDAPAELQRCATELTIVSVLLDAGAGADWKFNDIVSGQTYTRSEGLGLASLKLYASGHLSASGKPYLVDAAGLKSLTCKQLAECFQVSEKNPLIGLEARLSLLHQLGQMVATCPAIFGQEGRLGRLSDHLKSLSEGPLSIDTAFHELLKLLAVIWPERISGDLPLGDVWEYPGVGKNEPGANLIPFHKLTQWMLYSLTDAWHLTGLSTTDDQVLTALAEYRNGGLLLDMGVLKPRREDFPDTVFSPSDPEVVELRAMTVAVIDELASLINERLTGQGITLTLAQVLEGGTWTAGRKLAFARTPSGNPPIKYKADGTLF
ncbi:DUF1688 family protein [Hahella ganghwensis]|uniref:DUF1688 family protein n=1 Tax=Hahella ganghwensis TaxID=286420 RepID=UPI000375BE7A|nr:DUF1688 family protein [Hahella ganghwensis]